MKKNTGLLLLFFGTLFYQNIKACSIFSCSKKGQVLVAANEDEYTSFHYMWFVPRTHENYGAVFFGKNDMQSQAGMNEHGLFFDYAAIPRIDSKDRKIDFFPTTEILATCKTVEEALVLFQNHTFSAFSSQMLLADATGKSVLINADTIVHKIGDYQITTNFNVCDLKDKSYHCLRYDKINQALSTAKNISVDLFREVLDDVHQEGKVSTQYSSIYDLKNRKIHINWFHNFNETIVIDLEEELKKDFHIENLGDKFKHKNFAALSFQKNEDAYFYNKILDEFDQDGLTAGFELFEQFVKEYPEKGELIKEDFTWIPYGLISKARIAHHGLPFDYYYIPIVSDYKMVWKSDDKLLFQALTVLEYIETQQLKVNDFHFHEMTGYVYMVLGNLDSSIANYEKAILAVEEGSREEKRATKTLDRITYIKNLSEANEGLKYLGQDPPSSIPEIFAPNLVSKKSEYEFGSVFNKEATEFFYGVNRNGKDEIRYSRLIGKSWSKPKTLLEHSKYVYNDPFLSPDENRLYFISKRAMDGKSEPKDYDIWYVERLESGWSEPINAGENINSNSDEYYISFNRKGDMYFSSNKIGANFDIYTSRFIDDEFQEPTPLGDSINTPYYEADVFIDPNESFIIFCANRKEGFGQGDLYISHRKPDGSWSKSKNMGKQINTEGHELCPFVSNDGKYLFYTSNEDIYWVDAKILEQYKSE